MTTTAGTLIPGISVGHLSKGDTGCTAVVIPEGAVCSVDVRGGGPGTRETDLLDPANTVDRVHTVMLAGGSAYGLAAADGAMRALEERSIGFPMVKPGGPSLVVPIVPSVVIFDLFVGDPMNRPTAEDGYAAVDNALAVDAPHEVTDVLTSGTSNVGAGCGATAGTLRGGCGVAYSAIPNGDNPWWVAALVIANPVGNVIDPATGTLWLEPQESGNAALIGQDAQDQTPSSLNTTIGVVATNAPVTKAQAKRLAMVSHDGIARAIRPAHSPLDGDTLFCLSTGDGSGVDVPTMVELSRLAAEAVGGAIVDAVKRAEPGYGLKTFSQG